MFYRGWRGTDGYEDVGDALADYRDGALQSAGGYWMGDWGLSVLSCVVCVKCDCSFVRSKGILLECVVLCCVVCVKCDCSLVRSKGILRECVLCVSMCCVCVCV